MEKKTHKKLTAQERDLIAIWLSQQINIREIARRLKRSPSTISDEIRRNSFYDPFTEKKKFYVAIHAQARAEKRRSLAGRRYPLKNPEVYSYVLEKLGCGWSPEQIAGRLKKIYGKTMICHETIYRFIYAKGNQKMRLWEELPWKRKRRKKKSGRKVHRSRIPDRVSIRLRPIEADERLIFGHWEGDTMEGKRADKDGVHAEVERLSRLVRAKKIGQITSRETSEAQEKIFFQYPKKARRSTTLDNGRENHLHLKLKKKLKMNTYFCDPYSAWQKGTVEQTIGLLRRYLPKGSSFSDLSQEELNDIVEELNSRPRKVLNYNTPKEVFTTYLNT